MPYTVTLVDFHGDLPDSARKEAEERFRRTLDAKLGGAENFPYHFRAFTNAAESEANQLGRPEAEAAAAYMVAHHLAVQAGLRGLGDADEAYFEVRLG